MTKESDLIRTSKTEVVVCCLPKTVSIWIDILKEFGVNLNLNSSVNSNFLKKESLVSVESCGVPLLL